MRPKAHAAAPPLADAPSSPLRKCLILFNWLGPLISILSHHSADAFPAASSAKPKRTRPLLHAFLHAPPPVLLDLVNGLSDDVYTLHRLGFISRRVGQRAAYYADWCWFFTTVVNLVENGVERSVILEQQHQGACALVLFNAASLWLLADFDYIWGC